MRLLQTLAAALVIWTSSAQAVLIDYMDETYDVTTIGPVTTDASLAQLSSQIWWGNSEIARDFSDLVATQLGGTLNFNHFGALFAYAAGRAMAWDSWDDRTEGWSVGTSIPIVLAVATRVQAQVPEPTTAVLLGAGLFVVGFLIPRRIKRTPAGWRFEPR